MTEAVNLKDELQGVSPELHERINNRMVLVSLLNGAVDMLMAENEDDLNSIGRFHYEIKRYHKKIDELLHRQYNAVNKILSREEYDDYAADCIKFLDFSKAYVGLDKEKEAFIHKKTDATPYKMSLNPVGDIFLRSKDGWVITIPKAVAQNFVSSRQYEQAKQYPISVGVQIMLSEISHEEEQTDNTSTKV